MPKNTLRTTSGDFLNPLSIMQQQLSDRIGDLFDNEIPAFGSLNNLSKNTPAVDVLEQKDKWVIKAELPGINEQDIDAQINDDMVHIKAEKRDEHQEKDGDIIKKECSYGSYKRSFSLPNTADGDKAHASYKNGVLKIELPKKKEAQIKQRKLKISNK